MINNVKEKFKPDHLNQVVYLSNPQLSPNGKQLTYVRTVVEEKTGSFYSRILQYDIGKLEEKELQKTFKGNQIRQSFSPDGTKLAYLSDESGENQVWVKDFKTRQYYQLTTLRHGVKCFSWSPNSKMIAFEAAFWEADKIDSSTFKEMQPEERQKWIAEKTLEPQIIDEIAYKHDDAFGVFDGSVSHIGIVDLYTKEQKILTEFHTPSHIPIWSPDGNQLAYYGKPYKGTKAFEHEVFVCDLKGNSRQLTKGVKLLPDVPLVFNKNGKEIIYSALFEKEGATEQRLFKIPINGGETVHLFPEKEEGTCQSLNGMPTGRTFYGDAAAYYQIDEDGKWIYFLSSWKGRQSLFKVTVDGSEKVEVVLEGDFSIHSFCLPIGGILYAMIGDYTTIAELFQVNLKTGQKKQITFHNSWMDKYELATVEEVWLETKDGNDKIQGWVMFPPNFEKMKKYPAVLNIHGGPQTTYVIDFWHEFQSMARAGFIVLYCNPRGGSGYGLEFSNSKYAFRNEAYEDLLTFVEYAVERGWVDEEYIGVTGGSYGGYMVSKLIGSTDRFKAAIIQRGLVNTATSYGTGDLGFESSKTEDISSITMLDVLTKRARNSPIKYIDNMKTPLLILHGYKDYRCSFEQAEQLFIAMKERNPDVPVRLVSFPEENHQLTRTGKLQNQIRHLKEQVEWFEKYLRKSKECIVEKNT